MIKNIFIPYLSKYKNLTQTNKSNLKLVSLISISIIISIYAWFLHSKYSDNQEKIDKSNHQLTAIQNLKANIALVNPDEYQAKLQNFGFIVSKFENNGNDINVEVLGTMSNFISWLQNTNLTVKNINISKKDNRFLIKAQLS